MSDIYLSLTETPAVVTLSQPVISGALSSTVTVANTVTVALDANSLSALEQVTVTVGAAVSVSNFPATQTIAGTVTVGNSVTIGSLPAISGTVTVGNTVTIAGTVTAGLADVVADDVMHGVPHVRVNGGLGRGVELAGMDVSGGLVAFTEGGGIPVYPRDNTAANAPFPVAGTVTVGNTVTIAGTVTASLADVVTNDAYHALPHVRVNGGYGQGVELAGLDPNGNPSNIWEGGGIPVYPRDDASPSAPFPIAGTVTAVLAAQQADDTDPDVKFLQIGYFSADAFNNLDQYHAVSDKSPLPVINKTANLPSGALTTRFGSVTTAGTAQLTSAVTNASRKYLLLQNISSGAVTVGVGFVPTTTQGIALAAGVGLTFDAFCPTGAVHWLGATTGAAFTILEG
jgi:hypothetical protein